MTLPRTSDIGFRGDSAYRYIRDHAADGRSIIGQSSWPDRLFPDGTMPTHWGIGTGIHSPVNFAVRCMNADPGSRDTGRMRLFLAACLHAEWRYPDCPDNCVETITAIESHNGRGGIRQWERLYHTMGQTSTTSGGDDLHELLEDQYRACPPTGRSSPASAELRAKLFIWQAASQWAREMSGEDTIGGGGNSPVSPVPAIDRAMPTIPTDPGKLTRLKLRLLDKYLTGHRPMNEDIGPRPDPRVDVTRMTAEEIRQHKLAIRRWDYRAAHPRPAQMPIAWTAVDRDYWLPKLSVVIVGREFKLEYAVQMDRFYNDRTGADMPIPGEDAIGATHVATWRFDATGKKPILSRTSWPGSTNTNYTCGYIHPHANGHTIDFTNRGYFCFGSNEADLLELLSTRRMTDVLEMLTMCAQRYSPINPYVPLESWFPPMFTCVSCLTLKPKAEANRVGDGPEYCRECWGELETECPCCHSRRARKEIAFSRFR